MLKPLNLLTLIFSFIQTEFAGAGCVNRAKENS